MLANAIDRLEDVIDQETRSLMAGELSKLDEVGRRKSQLLLEITRLSRNEAPAEGRDAWAERFGQLREKLVVNMTLLGNYMTAAQDIQGVMDRAITAAHSDGTYSYRSMALGADA